MAEIRAFRALRYTPSAGPIGTLTAPPYDVIDEEHRKRLAHRNARNIVHLILPQGEVGRYRLAAERLEAWMREGAIAQERDPSLYLYRQTFSGPDGRSHVRTGFLGLLRMDPSGRSVRHHEKTLAKPLEDRMRLLRATRTQLSAVFVIYSDPAGTALRALEARSTTERPGPRSVANAAYGRRASELTPGAVLEFNDDEGVRHWMQPISDEQALAQARHTLAPLPVVIADGHHRYSAAQGFCERMRDAFGEDEADLPENFMLACFIRAEDPGLVVLPTHRLVRTVPGETPRTAAEVLASLAGRFDIQSLDVPPGPYPGDPFPQLRSEPARRVVIGARFARDPRLHVLILREGDAPFRGRALDPQLRGLDVSVLHELILEPEYQIDEEALRLGGRLVYERDPSRAATSLVKGETQAAFFLRPIPTSALFEITSHGLKLPQKSTFFAPKLATGLVLHRI